MIFIVIIQTIINLQGMPRADNMWSMNAYVFERACVLAVRVRPGFGMLASKLLV